MYKKADGSYEIPEGTNPCESYAKADFVTLRFQGIEAKAYLAELGESDIPNYEFVPLRRTFFFCQKKFMRWLAKWRNWCIGTTKHVFADVVAVVWNFPLR